MRWFIGGLVLGLVAGVLLAVAVTPPGLDAPKPVPAARATIQIPPPTAKIRWDLSSAFPGDLNPQGILAKRIIERIGALSGGSIAIKFHEPDALVPALEVFKAVSTGVVDAAYTSPDFAAANIPALQLFAGIPFGPGAGEYLAWIDFGGGQKLFDEIHHRNNVHGIVCGVAAPAAAGWFKKEIKSVDDFHGLRMALAGLGGRVMEKFGVDVSVVPADRIFQAMKQGDLDAASFSFPTSDKSLKLHEVADFYYFPGWQRQAEFFVLLINLVKWQTLDPAKRTIIETVCGDSVRSSLAESEATQFAALKSLVLDRIKIERWKPKTLEDLRKAWQQVVAEQAANDRDFARVWNSLSKFREDYLIWRELGYLD